MRLLIVFCMLLAVALSNHLTTFENLDVDKLLSNEGQRKAVFACLMDQGPCGDVQGLRDSIPELIKTKCGQCNSKQKQKYDYVSKVLFEKYPENFNALALKYSGSAQ